MNPQKIIFGLIASLLFFILACDRDLGKSLFDEKNSAKTNEKEGVMVKVVSPVKRSFKASLVVEGLAKANRSVRLHAMEAGYLGEIKKNVGDKVLKGETVVVLKSPEVWRVYQSSKANIVAEQAVYGRLQKVYNESPDLFPLQDLEVAKAKFEAAKVAFSTARERLFYLNVKAPFEGFITNRFVDEGALVHSGSAGVEAQSIVEIMDLDTIVLEVKVPAVEATSLRAGSEVKVVFPTLNAGPFSVNVNRLSGVLDQVSKTMIMEIDVPNKDLLIKPGMRAEVHFAIESNNNVLSIPHVTLIKEDSMFFVYVVKNGVALKTPLSTGLQNEEFVEILNHNINNADEVIVAEKGLVNHGLKVKTMKY